MVVHFRPPRDRGKLHLLVQMAALLPGQGRAGGQGPAERHSDASARDGGVLAEMRDGEDALTPHGGPTQAAWSTRTLREAWKMGPGAAGERGKQGSGHLAGPLGLQGGGNRMV